MAQSLASILVHLVFSTKNREPFIAPASESELPTYRATSFRECKSPGLLVGGTRDHSHALFVLSRTWALADMVEAVKTNSSKWIKTQGREFHGFHWQSGYGAFSIGQSQTPQVKHYIANQHEQHRRRSFQDELRALLKQYEIEYAER